MSAHLRSLVNRISVRAVDLNTVRSASFVRSDYPDFPFLQLMSKKDAGTALNLHPRKALEILSDWPSHHGHEGTVPVEAVEQLVAEFVSPAELGIRLGCAMLGAIRAAERFGIYPSSLAGFDRQAIIDQFGTS